MPVRTCHRIWVLCMASAAPVARSPGTMALKASRRGSLVAHSGTSAGRKVLSTVAAPRAMSAWVAMLVLSTRRSAGFCVKMAGLM